MTREEKNETPLAIGHVLFLDLVGYSKLTIEEQQDRVRRLTEIVLATPQVIQSTNEQLVRLPTGDGMALVFRESAEEPARCALAVAHAVQAHPEMAVRMGIHSGPVSEVIDVNGRTNIAGAGINIAQRVMSVGDAGHILLSKHVADDLAQYSRWRSSLRDLGECEMKHGVVISLVNLCAEGVGNRARPARLAEQGAAAQTSTVRERSPLVVRQIFLGALLLLAIGALIFFGPSLWRRLHPTPPMSSANLPLPQKGVAVLPFENLSSEKENAYFTDGVQDEILTDLAKIADLKVISRSSVMQYKAGAPRDLRKIGRQLGVAHLLEGSVQRFGNKIRVNAQLINAASDTHEWAENYDRDLADVFAIQSEIAKAIADQLQAKLEPGEEERLADKPTANSEAYLVYLQANDLVHVAASKSDVIDADRTYARAIELDPRFALAYARASMLNSLMYSVGRDPERKTRARELAGEALRLAPDSGDTHLARGLCFYRLDGDYVQALEEFSRAATLLPNNAEIDDYSGYVYRRQGKWEKALASFRRARELDPRQAQFDGLPETLRLMRRWPEANEAYRLGLQIEPQLSDGWIGLADLQFAQSGDPAQARATLENLPESLRTKPPTMDALWRYAMLARDFAAAKQTVPTENEFPNVEVESFYRGCIAYAQGDTSAARDFFEAARPLHESAVRDHPDDPTFHALLARLYVLSDHKDEAVRDARRAVELCPIAKDAVQGPNFEANLAFVDAHAGNPDEAIAILTRLLTVPADEITLADLRKSWEWDPLRSDPRFEKLIAEQTAK